MVDELDPLPPAIPGLEMQIGEFNCVPIETEATLTTAGEKATPSKPLTAAAAFLWTHLVILADDDFTFVISSSNTDSAFTVDESEIDGNSFRGQEGFNGVFKPIPLPVAHYFPGSTTITLKVTNINANPNNIRALLFGQRVRVGSLLEKHLDNWWKAIRPR